MTTTDDHVLQDGDRQVSFCGDLLSSASTEEDGKERWSEMFIYLKCDGGYVVHGVGRSSVEGETSREWIRDCATADAVIKALTRRADDVSYMPKVNVVLLQRASQIDDALHEASSTQAI